jgi:hypothetical protein
MTTRYPTHPTESRRSRAWPSAVLAIPLIALLALALGAAPASASQAITSFSVTATANQTGVPADQAGAHPDLTLSFALEDPGDLEAAKDVVVNTPEGVFGNPNAIDRCSAEDFALDQCSASSQAGLVTIYANNTRNGGTANQLLGTAPVFDRETVGDETALFSFVVPTLGIPIQVPVSVRTAGDYGLRFKVANLTQSAPLASAEITLWGFPAFDDNDAERFPRGTPGNPAGCPGVAAADVAGPSCLDGEEVPSPIPTKPLINNPSVCAGGPLATSIEVTTYQDPDNPAGAQDAYPEPTGCH